jgi:hypothetical protein
MRQAPHLGEQTVEIAAELLGLDPEHIDALVGSGALEVARGVAPAAERKRIDA